MRAVLREKHTQLFPYIRGQVLFYTSYVYQTLFGLGAGVVLESNVRFQRVSTFFAESPSAKILVGKNSILYEHAKVHAYGKSSITIGESSVIGDTRIFARNVISIGCRTLTSWGVLIQDFDPHPTDPHVRKQQVQVLTDRFSPNFTSTRNLHTEYVQEFSSEPITIGDDVWIGAQAIILKGVTIGSGSIVAAGAVVTRGDYPTRSVIAGNPARVVSTL